MTSLSHAPPTIRMPGSVVIAIAVALLFVTPVFAATTLRPLAIRWDALIAFIGAHQLALLLGFSLMAALGLLFKTRQAPDNTPPAQSTSPA